MGGDKFAFVHRGFLEFFCADWISERPKKAPSTAERELLEIFSKYSVVPNWREVLTLSTSALAPELVDSILSKLKLVKSKRSVVPIWLFGAVFQSQKSRNKFPKTVSAFFGKIGNEVKEPSGKFSAKTVISTLIQFWPEDSETRKLLEFVMQASTVAKTKAIALKHLIKKWPDSKTKETAFLIARKSTGRMLKSAVAGIVGQWRDEDCRTLLKDLIKMNLNGAYGMTAFHHLIFRFKDDDTLSFAVEIAGGNQSFPTVIAANDYVAKHSRPSSGSG